MGIKGVPFISEIFVAPCIRAQIGSHKMMDELKQKLWTNMRKCIVGDELGTNWGSVGCWASKLICSNIHLCSKGNFWGILRAVRQDQTDPCWTVSRLLYQWLWPLKTPFPPAIWMTAVCERKRDQKNRCEQDCVMGVSLCSFFPLVDTIVTILYLLTIYRRSDIAGAWP